MKRWWHYLLLGVFAWLTFLVWRLPAHVAYNFAAPRLPLPIKAGALHGTVWQGDGLLQYQGGLASKSTWQLSPWSLLMGRLGATVNLQNGENYLSADVEMPLDGGEVQFSQLNGSASIALIQPYLSLVPVQLQGDISVKLQELSLTAEGHPQRAEGKVVWYRAGAFLTEKLPLGDLQMVLHTRDKGGIEGKISDTGGPLQIAATLTIESDGSLKLSGQVKSTEQAIPALRNALAMLGKRDARGFYPLNLSL